MRAEKTVSLNLGAVTDAEGHLGDAIHLPNSASKEKSGKAIPMSKDLKAAFALWMPLAQSQLRPSQYVVTTKGGTRTSSYKVVNKFAAWCRALGLVGARSHSGDGRR